MATAESRANLIRQLKRRPTSSPHEEAYTTASESVSDFNPARDAINSTMQMPDNTTQQPLPEHHAQQFNYAQPADNGSDRSTQMSIELGRGFKRGAQAHDEDGSSNMIFSMGNGSLYELTGPYLLSS